MEALRLVQDPSVDAIIAMHLSDRDAGVRLAALTATKARKPSEALARPLKELMLKEVQTSVRGKAIRIGAIWLRQRPDLRYQYHTFTVCRFYCRSDHAGL